MNHYILENKTPKLVSAETWNIWYQKADRQLFETIFTSQYEAEIRISTVFLGIDYWFMGTDDPILFETMVFNGELDEEAYRCDTYEEAEINHVKMVERVKMTLTDEYYR